MSHKPKIAFFDFTGCEGCQLTVLDSLQTHPDLLAAVEIVEFREAASAKGEDYQIAFVEGSLTRPEDEVRLRAIRARAETVVALGACAHLGGVNALRNWHSGDEVSRYVYGEMGKLYDVPPPRPIGAAIQVDAVIPGCPIDREEFVRTVKALLQGRRPHTPDYPVCVECKLRETGCVVRRGKSCLGPIVRGGCGALCPGVGVGCEGCRGLIPTPNIQSLQSALQERGVGEAEIAQKMMLFLSYQVSEMEMSDHASP